MVFRRTERGVRLLVLRAYKNWDFPKGLIEPGETELDAAKRETAEETGLTDLDFPFGDAHKDTVPYAGGKVARYFIAETGATEIELPVSRRARPARAPRMALGQLRGGRGPPAAAPWRSCSSGRVERSGSKGNARFKLGRSEPTIGTVPIYSHFASSEPIGPEAHVRELAALRALADVLGELLGVHRLDRAVLRLIPETTSDLPSVVRTAASFSLSGSGSS